MADAASTSATGPTESLYFPLAGQSDILRASQKDELCLRALESSLRDVVHSYFGSASLHKYGDSIRALATTAYYATSIGAGQRTLGEEYCDLLQVTASKLEPTQASRALQVLLHTAIPLLRSKLASLEDAGSPPESPITTAPTHLAFESAGDIRQTLIASALPSSPCLSTAFDSVSDLAEVLMASQVTPVPADTLALPPESGHSGHSQSATPPLLSPAPSSPVPRNGNGHAHGNGNGNGQCQGGSDSAHQAGHGPSAEHGSHMVSPADVVKDLMLSCVPSCTFGLLSDVRNILAAGYRRMWRFASKSRLAQWLPIVTQLHLALFYIFGLYYEAPKRLVGSQYVHIGASGAQRRYFGAMGLLLLVQVLVNAQTLRRTGEPQDQEKKSQQQLIVHPVDVASDQTPEAGDSVHSHQGTGAGVGLPLPSRTAGQCPLCLADRVVPTALPCGHVFCWKCAVEWCQRKPVCPVCRLGAQLQELVPLTHAVL